MRNRTRTTTLLRPTACIGTAQNVVHRRIETRVIRPFTRCDLSACRPVTGRHSSGKSVAFPTIKRPVGPPSRSTNDEKQS